jgi:type II secretory pathway pseudopilin PulG
MKPPVIRSSLLRQPVLYSRTGRHLLLQRSDQNGFALIAVLAVIAITSVTIGALLGMMLTAIKITENQERDARQARAADGAVTAAINQLRLQQDPAKDACTPGLPSLADGGLPLTFESSGRSDTATVSCRTAADELGESAGDIELSGTERDWKLFRDSSEVSSDLKNLIDPPSETNLVHWGNSALKFNGNLSSTGGAVPFRYDPEGTPALDVRGTYDQAAKGIGAAAGSAASCGELSGAAAVAATTVRASGGARCGDPLLVPVSATQEPDIDEQIPTSPDLSAGCPDETVIEFDPGKYDQNAVATLNKWFGRGDGSCRNKTFYFPNGRYWFDANTVINGVGAENQHALTFNNPSSTFVFGQANGWDPAVAGPTAANFPKACDPALSGASIILSGRTEFRHLAGRLAVCPYRDETDASATPDPALAQQPTVPTQITATSGASALFTCDVEPGKDTCEASRTFPVTTLDSRMSEDISSAWLNVTGDETGQNVSLVTTRTASLSVVLPGGAKCDVPATTGAPDNNGVATYDLLATAGNCGGIITSGEQLDGAQVEVEYSYTYFRLPPCPNYPSAPKCPILPGKAQSLTIQNMEVIANPWEGSATSVGASPTGGWLYSNDAQKDDSKSATLRTPCKNNICLRWPEPSFRPTTERPDPSFTRELTMADFKNSGEEETGEGDSFPDPHVESLGVLIKQALPDSPPPFPNSFNLASTLNGETTLTLTLSDAVNPADKTDCAKSFSGVINQAGAHYFPLISQSEDPCGGRLLLAAQRSPAALVSLSVSFRLDCIEPGPSPFYFCDYLQPVPIQYVGLVATSDSYSKVTKSQLTIDSAAAVSGGGSTGGPASANFFGSAYLKNVALDLNWNGQASGASLFGGELQLNSLGSLMAPTATADVVCCTAPETNIRKVRLTALVDGEAKLSAVVALNSKEKTAPVVLEWTVCGRNGNCSS